MAEVSVIIPFYNTDSQWLKQAVQSVLSQTFQDFELILVNDGSDQCYDLTYCFSPKGNVHIITQAHKGVGAARNTGIRFSQGRYIAFLDSDDEWLPKKLELQLVAMGLDPKCLFSHTSYYRMDEGRFEPVDLGYVTGNIYPWIGLRCRIATPTVIVRREALNLLRFDESLKTGEDSLLWTQIARRSSIIGVPLYLTKVRIHRKPIADRVVSVARNMKWIICNV